VIVSDEVQRHWRPRGMGTKVPLEIAELETHRHKGVDLVLITQNPMLLDQNVRRLVGRHLHVRRIFGGARALIYDWDGCQTETSRTAGATRTLWSYPKDAFKLYKSSELHTKQHQKIPLWFAFPLVVVTMGAFAGPKAFEVMHRSMTGRPVAGPAAAAPARPASAASASAPAASAPPGAVPLAQSAPPVYLAQPPRVQGCIALPQRCECFGTSGARIELPEASCREGSHRVGTVVPLAPPDASVAKRATLGGVPDQPTPSSGESSKVQADRPTPAASTVAAIQPGTPTPTPRP
jgi:zona occludens toxin